VRGLEKRHGGSGFSLEESGVGTVGALVGVISCMLATEISDVSVRDTVSACDHFASLHKSHAVFFFDCRLLTARIPTWLVPFGRLEVDQQTVGCGQIGRILVVASGEVVLEIGPKGAKTTTVGTLEEGQSKSAVTRDLEALCCIVCVGRDSSSGIEFAWVFANGAAIVLQDLDEGTKMLEVGGNRVFNALGVGVVGGARVVKGEVGVALTLETIRDALDFLQNPNTITFVTLCLEK